MRIINMDFLISSLFPQGAPPTVGRGVCFDRTSEKSVLTSLLRQTSRIIVINGPHNTGKSTLCEHVVRSLGQSEAIVINLRESVAMVESIDVKLLGALSRVAEGAMSAFTRYFSVEPKTSDVLNKTESMLLQAGAIISALPEGKRYYMLIDEFQKLLELTESKAVKDFFGAIVNASKAGKLVTVLATSDSSVSRLTRELSIADYSSNFTLLDSAPDEFVSHFPFVWAVSRGGQVNALDCLARLAFAEVQLPAIMKLVGTRWLDVEAAITDISIKRSGASQLEEARHRLESRYQGEEGGAMALVAVKRMIAPLLRKAVHVPLPATEPLPTVAASHQATTGPAPASAADLGITALPLAADDLGLIKDNAAALRRLLQQTPEISAVLGLIVRADQGTLAALYRPPQFSEAALKSHEASVRILERENFLFRQAAEEISHAAAVPFSGKSDAIGPASMAIWHAMKIVVQEAA